MAGLERQGKARAHSLAEKAGGSRKVLRALLAFSAEQPRHSAESLSKSLNLPLSSTYRYVALLREARLIEEDGRGHFILSSRVAEMARIASGSCNLGMQARPHLKRLVKSLNQTTLLVKRNDHLAICVASERAPSRTRFLFDVGVALPLTHGAAPKVLLAHLPRDEQLDIISRIAERDPDFDTRRTDLLTELATIREQGWAESKGEIQSQISALAVGVFNEDRELIAALSAIRPASSVPSKDTGMIVHMLRVAADGIAESLRA